ncbi:serine/threonine-protein kinase [Streptomyces sp. NRRL B-1347]|uniref:serine/threonine-protein kinase n=1 Tax=Streptomyces sp. NRRL B-1347 TaxID=1476877 RepID=UPI002D21E16B|nr:serine/threonine-protein kinase [Streptomyces sp. NRRL B-1347]
MMTPRVSGGAFRGVAMVEGGQPFGGRFQLIEELGRGGMGVVWRAVDTLLGREVAVKHVRGPGQGAAPLDTKATARLLREARAAAKLNHPGAVTVYDVVRAGSEVVIVMELVRGTTLAALVAREGPLPPARVASIGAQLAEVLGAAHAMGVIHRDVKPENVMLLAGGRVKLADFGIARLSSEVTSTTSVFGTPAYMAPEQIRGAPVPATDLWALGVTLFHALEGASPFARPAAVESIAAVLSDPPPVSRRAGPALGAVLYALLAKNPEERPHVAQAAAELRQIAEGRVTTMMAAAPMAPRRPPPAPAVPPPTLPWRQAARPASLVNPVLPGLLGLGTVGLWVLSWFQLNWHAVLTGPGLLVFRARPFETWWIDAGHTADASGPDAPWATVAAGYPFGADGVLNALLVLAHLPFLGLLIGSWASLVSPSRRTWAGLLAGSGVLALTSGFVINSFHQSQRELDQDAWLNSGPYLLAGAVGLLAVVHLARHGGRRARSLDRRRLIRAAAGAATGATAAGIAVPGLMSCAVAVLGTLAVLLWAGLVLPHRLASSVLGGWALAMAVPLALGITVAAHPEGSSIQATVSTWHLVVLAIGVAAVGCWALVHSHRAREAESARSGAFLPNQPW